MRQLGLRWNRWRTVGVIILAVAAAMTACSSPAPEHSPDADNAPRLLFADEFDGEQLDTDTWTHCYPWTRPGEGCTNNPDVEREWYEPHNAAVSGGNLELTARHETASNRAYKFTSGLITTGGVEGGRAPSFAFRYGYAEISAKLAIGAGMWPAFWLLATDYRFPPEIDIMEGQGIKPRWYLTNIFAKGTDKPEVSKPSEHSVEEDLTAGFHTYAVEWTPTSLRWYFDRRLVATVTDPALIPHEYMYLLLNLAVGGWLPGQLPPDVRAFPAIYRVDWVRVWSATPY